MLSIPELAKAVKDKYGSTQVLFDEPMKNHTSFRIGGKVKAMFVPDDENAVRYISGLCKENGIRCELIGNGSNILFSDTPSEMVVVKTGEGISDIKLLDGDRIYAQCGALLSRIAVFAMNNGLTGFEFAHGIPGSLGGAVIMNAGAYGGEMKDVIESVKSLSGTFSGDECDFSYRHSRFSETGDAVLSAVITLSKGDSAAIKARMNELSEKRRNSQPINMPSAGSTFKRPVGGYAAALIDEAGLKGYTVGGAQVSEKHAGFVINKGGATFDDVIKIIEDIKERVYKTSGIMLEPEVKIIT